MWRIGFRLASIYCHMSASWTPEPVDSCCLQMMPNYELSIKQKLFFIAFKNHPPLLLDTVWTWGTWRTWRGRVLLSQRNKLVSRIDPIFFSFLQNHQRHVYFHSLFHGTNRCMIQSDAQWHFFLLFSTARLVLKCRWNQTKQRCKQSRVQNPCSEPRSALMWLRHNAVCSSVAVIQQRWSLSLLFSSSHCRKNNLQKQDKQFVYSLKKKSLT